MACAIQSCCISNALSRIHCIYRYVFIILLCTTLPIWADTLRPAEEVIVTATLTPLPLAQNLRPVSVLTHDDIKNAQAASMLELLERLPGLQFSRTGGLGGNTSLFLRGSNSNHVLVLIDGVRVSNANGGVTPWNELLPQQIEHIEVVRGPRAALYGSDAIGGVVQIFTHSGNKEKANVQHVQIAHGTNNTVRADAQFAYYSEQVSASIGVSAYDTQGISHRDSGGINDDDSARAKTAKIFLRHALANPESEVRLNYLRTRSSHEFDGFAPPPDQMPADIREENLLESINAVYDLYTQHDWRTTVELGYSRNDNKNINPDNAFGLPLSRFNSKRRSLRWVNTIDTDSHGTWLAGAEYYQDSVQRDQNTPDNTRHNSALFLEYQYLLRLSQIIVFARADRNEQYGAQNSVGVDWGIDILSWLKFTASYGESFHAPTFNDLYGFGGNLNLEPEEAVNTEIGIRGEHDNIYWAVHLFNNEVESLISVIRLNPDSFDFRAVNIDKARIRGLELEFNARWDKLSANASISLLDPKNQRDDSVLLRRARRELKAGLRYEWNHWTFATNLIARGRRYDFCATGTDNCLGGYALLNLSAAWQFHPQWRMQLNINNVGSKHYRLAAGYNTEERTALFSIRWQSN